jgi:hypothetical protein
VLFFEASRAWRPPCFLALALFLLLALSTAFSVAVVVDTMTGRSCCEEIEGVDTVESMAKGVDTREELEAFEGALGTDLLREITAR